MSINAIKSFPGTQLVYQPNYTLSGGGSQLFLIPKMEVGETAVAIPALLVTKTPSQYNPEELEYRVKGGYTLNGDKPKAFIDLNA